MERSFIDFNGVLINTRYIKKIYKIDNYNLPTKSFCYEIGININDMPTSYIERYKNEKDRDDRFFVLEEILTINYQ